jgi:hypothetical protein
MFATQPQAEVGTRKTLMGDVCLNVKVVTLFCCEHCGLSFTPRNCNQKFCCKTCRMEHGRNVTENRSCEFCKHEFRPTNERQRFCSTVCRVDNWREPERLRRNAWTAARLKDKHLEFDGRYAGADNKNAGDFRPFQTDIRFSLKRTLDSVSEKQV